MSNSNEILASFSPLQNTIWQSVSLTVSEAANMSVNLANPLTVVSQVSDLYSELAQPFLVIQFAFSNSPENTQVMLMSQEHFGEFASLVRETAVPVVDENVVAETRGVLEALVQGICLAVGNVRNEAFLATGLSTRFQIFALPPNFQKVTEVVRTNVAVTVDEFNGSLIWITDMDTAAAICGVNTAPPAPAEAPFGKMETTTAPATPWPVAANQAAQDSNPGLDLLMDIPLEISVELGRVRMQFREVVDLGAGSIVEIDKAAGEPVDVLVNGRLVARGEVVVIEDNFGVRITEILSTQERLQRLNDAA